MADKTQKIQPYKTEGIKKIKELIESSRDVIFTDFRGLDVNQLTELRRSLQQKEAEYRVVKNNFARLALSELGLDFEEEFLIDPTALALVKNDIGPISKVLFDFTRDSTLRIKGGLIEGKVLSPEQVEAISKLPGREQLYAMLMGTMNAPLTNLMYAMSGVVTKLVRTLQAVAESKEKQ
ncbi:MAG: 50S ribosomal protein L10 [Spirochaetaceae bacterium]|nr:MAG: 50S ribosomal protein L10 [Spirochaetaceae bacterium]